MNIIDKLLSDHGVPVMRDVFTKASYKNELFSILEDIRYSDEETAIIVLKGNRYYTKCLINDCLSELYSIHQHTRTPSPIIISIPYTPIDRWVITEFCKFMREHTTKITIKVYDDRKWIVTDMNGFPTIRWFKFFTFILRTIVTLSNMDFNFAPLKRLQTHYGLSIIEGLQAILLSRILPELGEALGDEEMLLFDILVLDDEDVYSSYKLPKCYKDKDLIIQLNSKMVDLQDMFIQKYFINLHIKCTAGNVLKNFNKCL